MKKLILLLIGVMLLPIMLFAQTEDIIASFDLGQYFTNLGVFVGAVVVVSQFALKYVNIKKGIQVFTWFISLLVAGAGWLFQFGIFVDMSWYFILIYGFSGGLCANGFFKIKYVQEFLDYLLPKLGKK